MDSRPLVLIADDEPAASRLVALSLADAGFNVATAENGRAAVDRVWELNPDVLLLDIVMPDMSGIDVLRELRTTHPVPIILVSGRESVAQVTEGLDLGADDYVRKPFSGPELAARIRAVLRRRRQGGSGRHRLGSVLVDLDAGRILVDGEVVDPSRKEWLLLERLIRAEGGVVTHDELLTAAFGPAYVDDAAYLRLWIGQLRRRLGVPAWEEGPIRTIPGIGYALDPSGEIPVRRSRRPRDTDPAPTASRPAPHASGRPAAARREVVPR